MSVSELHSSLPVGVLPEKKTTPSPKFEGSLFSIAKVKRVFYYFLGALSAFLGAASAIASLIGIIPLWVGLTSIPLALSSYYLFSLATSIWDYEDPSEIAELRRRALQMSLIELSSQHGWQNIFLYQILRPHDFLSSFHYSAAGCDIPVLLQIYKRIQQGLALARQNSPEGFTDYKLPDLSLYRSRFVAEIKSLSFNEFFQKYNVHDLFGHNYISEKQMHDLIALKQKYDQVVAECKMQIEYTHARFLQKVPGARLVTDAGRFLGHELLWSCRSYSSTEPEETFDTIRNHLGIDILSIRAFRNLKEPQKEERLSAISFHQQQLKQKLQEIDHSFEDLCNRIV